MMFQFNAGGAFPSQGCRPNQLSQFSSQFMMMGMMGMMMQWLQSFFMGNSGMFQPGMHPGFGGGGFGGGFGGGGCCGGASQLGQLNSNFLGHPFGGPSGYHHQPHGFGGHGGYNGNSNCEPCSNHIPDPSKIDHGPGRTSGAFGAQTVGGRASMKEGYLFLKDPKTGEVLGRYQFRNGGNGRGAIPWGDYQVSNGRRRSDVSSMMSEGYGYSFDLTQKGQPHGQARDPRYSSNRSLLRVHPDGGGKGTMGCIGIVGGREVQKDFYEKARQLQEANGGNFSLSFQPAQQGGSTGGSDGPQNRTHPLSDKAVNLIAKSEGFDQPGKWPGASSGITIGVGYDLGYMTKEQFRKDWHGKLPEQQFRRLEQAIGVKGQRAKSIAHQFRDIKIPKNQAMDVFHNSTLPRYYNQAKKAFPGMERMPADAQGALTSLVFNRGTSMSGARRAEMRNIRSLVANYQGQGSLNSIAGQIQSMKRLWVGKGLGGLLTRRDNEAALLQQSIYS